MNAFPTPAELAHLAAMILGAEKGDSKTPRGAVRMGAPHAVEQAWQIWELAAKRIDQHNAEVAERERLEAERLSGLVPFESVPGYKNPMPFELAVRRALAYLGEPVPPDDVRLVVDGFAFKSHLEILRRYNRELSRKRQENYRMKATKTPPHNHPRKKKANKKTPLFKK